MLRLGGVFFLTMALSACAPAAPDIRLPRLGGGELSLARTHGGPTLLVFFTTTCAPCVSEAPTLAAFYPEFKRNGGEMVAVALAQDAPARVADFAQRLALPYPIVFDLDGEAARAYDVRAIPQAVLIDTRGRVVWDRLGALDMAQLRRLSEEAR